MFHVWSPTLRKLFPRLQSSAICLTMNSVVSTRYTRVTYRQTGKQTPHDNMHILLRYSYASRGKKGNRVGMAFLKKLFIYSSRKAEAAETRLGNK